MIPIFTDISDEIGVKSGTQRPKDFNVVSKLRLNRVEVRREEVIFITDVTRLVVSGTSFQCIGLIIIMGCIRLIYILVENIIDLIFDCINGIEYLL